METKYKVILTIVAVATVFAIGRYTAPEKIRIEKQIIEVEKKTENKNTDKNQDKHTKTIIVEVTKPDGTKETTTTITDDTKTDTKTNVTRTDDTNKSEIDIKEVIRNHSVVTINALTGTSFSISPTPTMGPAIFGAHITKSILGPITVGGWGLSNGTGGVSVGLTF